MTAQKRKRQDPIETPFDEAIARFLQTDPAEVGEAMTRGLVNRMKSAEKRIRDAREEISRGARSGKKPFRL